MNQNHQCVCTGIPGSSFTGARDPMSVFKTQIINANKSADTTIIRLFFTKANLS